MKKRIVSILLALGLLLSAMPTSLAVSSRTPYEAANALYMLNLFRGTGEYRDGTPVFSLADAPTRAEAVTMLVRLLGKEAEAHSRTWSTPFTDVPDWAAPYIGYAYESRLAQGEADTRFGSEEIITANDYLTFLLRALGYRDSEGDFSWSNASFMADTIGLTNGEYNSGGPFVRGDIAKLSCNALALTPKGEQITLLQMLLNQGTVTKEMIQKAGLSAYLTVQESSTLTNASDTKSNREMTAAEIYAACSPAVFYIEVFDAKENIIGAGSGFFISSDGKAVTNYHVIEDASYAKVTLADGETTYDVTGIYDYNAEQDVALIKVSGKDFPYLTPGDASYIIGGAAVYAIGSPRGLNNSISEGIISNVNREIEGTNYIQITAAISPGSSGGALLNNQGKVIGITSAGLTDSQNLNFAVPYTSAAKLSSHSLQTLSQSLANRDGGTGSFYASQSSVTLQAGTTKTLMLTQTYSVASQVGFDVEYRQIARVYWGSGQSTDGSQIPFVIAGLNPGETDVLLTLYSKNDAILAQITIHIKVV